jgi:predicted transcriptional regulator
MTELIDAAARRLPHTVSIRARRAALLEVAGFSSVEVAQRLGVTTRTLRRDREALRAAIVQGLHEDGYSDREIALALGLPKPMSALAA